VRFVAVQANSHSRPNASVASFHSDTRGSFSMSCTHRIGGTRGVSEGTGGRCRDSGIDRRPACRKGELQWKPQGSMRTVRTFTEAIHGIQFGMSSTSSHNSHASPTGTLHSAVALFSTHRALHRPPLLGAATRVRTSACRAVCTFGRCSRGVDATSPVARHRLRDIKGRSEVASRCERTEALF